MRVSIERSPTAVASFELEAGEQLLAAPGRLLSRSGGVSLGIKLGASYRPLRRGLWRVFYALWGFVRAFWQKLTHNQDAFWHLYESKAGGRVILTPSLPGEITELPVGERSLYFHPESFLACTQDVEITCAPRSPLLRAVGKGSLFLCSFGEIASFEVDGNYALDVERLVALEPSLSFQMQSPKQVVELFGKGTLWVQTGKLSGLSRLLSLRAAW